MTERAATKAILFDKDGTLLDFQASWGGWSADLITAMSAGNADLRAALAARLDIDLVTRRVGPSSVIIAGTPTDIIETIADLFPGRTVASLTDEVVELAREVRPVPVVGLAESLNQLKNAGIILGVATNDAEAIARSQLNELHIADHFAFVAGFDSGHGGKPAPGMCKAFCAETGIDAVHCLMVGDSLHDLESGRAAGMKTVAVLTGVATEADLAPHADIVLSDVTQLLGLVGL